MKLYFRFIIEYDFRRVGYESCRFDAYSLQPFDKSLTPLDGFYHYSEYDLFDLFTEEEAIELAIKLKKNLNNMKELYNQAIEQKKNNS